MPKTLFCYLLCLVFSLSVWAGSEVGHGGDPLAGEFVSRGIFVQDYLTHTGREILNELEIMALAREIEKTRIEVTDAELKDEFGTPVVGLVVPDPKIPHQSLIRLNRKKWAQCLADGQGTIRFVFHEYLWVIKKYDLNYVLSSKLPVQEKDYLEWVVPRRYEMQETIAGDFISETSSAGQDTAQKSYQEKCDSWRKNLSDQYKSKLTYATCGKSETAEQKLELSTGKNLPYGLQASSKGKAFLLFQYALKPTTINDEIASPQVILSSPSVSAAQAARKEVERLFQVSCEEWKAKVKDYFGKKFFNASCEGSSISSIDVNGSSMQKVSHAMIHYFNTNYLFERGDENETY